MLVEYKSTSGFLKLRSQGPDGYTDDEDDTGDNDDDDDTDDDDNTDGLDAPDTPEGAPDNLDTYELV